MTHKYSARDEQLSAELGSPGSRVARRMERLREAGLIAARERLWRGSPAGSDALPAEDELERAKWAVVHLRGDRRSHRAVLTMFATTEFPIERDRLDAAYEHWFELFDRLLGVRGKALGARGRAQEVAEWVAHYAAKMPEFQLMRTRLKETRNPHSRTTVRVMLESPLEELVLIMSTGQPTSLQGLAELLDAVAMQEVVTDPRTGKSHGTVSPGDLLEVMRVLEVGELRGVLLTTPMASLNTARDRAVAFRTFVRTYGTFLARAVGVKRAVPWLIAGSTSDVGLALSVPCMAWLAERFPTELPQLFDQIAAWTELFSALNKLLDEFPSTIPSRLDALLALDADQTRELQDVMAKFASQYPAESNLIEAAAEA